MDSIFNFAIEMDEDEFTTSKKDVLKFLKIIGVLSAILLKKFILIT